MPKLLLALALAAAALPAQSSADGALLEKLETQRKLIRDWGGLTHYGSDNSELPPPEPGENRVVFLGDEITAHWGEESEFFPGKSYVNRGVPGQATPQMLVRFRQDVIQLEPKVVVIQGGMNDIAALTVPGTKGMIAENFQSMADLAKAHGIAVVLASLTPVCDCGNPLAAFLPRGKLFGLNDWIEEYAEQNGAVYLNYYSALAAGRNFKREWTKDGIVPNAAGYAVMAQLAEEAIAKALAMQDGR